jgi:hypothetical protein
MKKGITIGLAAILWVALILPAPAAAQQSKAYKIEKERSEFLQLLSQDPNYFGTQPGAVTKAVKSMHGNTSYEEATCLGFSPEKDELEAVVQVKKPYGYAGNLCRAGSYEYVRFFIDWNGDGDFLDKGEDVGLSSVNVHDIPSLTELCLDKPKPLSYSVRLKIDPERLPCEQPQLVQARAVLSWRQEPPPGEPNFMMVWGNAINAWIQIEPKTPIMLEAPEAYQIYPFGDEIEPWPYMTEASMYLKPTKPLTEHQLEKLYEGRDVSPLRFKHKKMEKLAGVISMSPEPLQKYLTQPGWLDTSLLAELEPVFAEAGDVSYEQLYCVGLNYRVEHLVGVLKVKRPYGYSGDKCTAGSFEYITFWVYVPDTSGLDCEWEYLGTAAVNVHDIPGIPPEGLWYAASVPVDLNKYRRLCHDPRVLRIRAVLSWNTPHPETSPETLPIWGNRVDAQIQLRPGPAIITGKPIPVITDVGNMLVANIAGNSLSTTPAFVPAGYALGVSPEGFSANESPFGGRINIQGFIANPPDAGSANFPILYKVQYKASGDTEWRDMMSRFYIGVTHSTGSAAGPQQLVLQEPDGDNYYKYRFDPQTGSNDASVLVEDNMLMHFNSLGLDSDGQVQIRVLVKDPQQPVHHASAPITLVVDNTRPEGTLVLVGGPCPEIVPDSPIEATFAATDKHISYFSFDMLPYNAPAGQLTHIPIDNWYPALSAPGVTAADGGRVKIDTRNMVSCGYVLRLHIRDRTIVNSWANGWRRSLTVGLCILKK